jgi:hypothetical protein
MGSEDRVVLNQGYFACPLSMLIGEGEQSKYVVTHYVPTKCCVSQHATSFVKAVG